jgi:hypothetical protein
LANFIKSQYWTLCAFYLVEKLAELTGLQIEYISPFCVEMGMTGTEAASKSSR